MAQDGMLRAGLRARARVHLAVLVAAVLVVAAAVVGAVFSAAAQESISRDTVAAAPGGPRVHLDVTISEDDPTLPPQLLPAALRVAPQPGQHPGFPRRIAGLTLPTDVRVSALAGAQPTRLVWRQGSCLHLRLVAGRCPGAAGEAVISQATAASGPGWRMGAEFTAGSAGDLRVVGLYRPRAEGDPFWAGVDHFDGGLRPVAGGDARAGAQVLGIDSVFVAQAEFQDRVRSGARASIDYPFDPDATTIGDGSALRHRIAAITRSLPADRFTVRTDMGGLLRASTAQRRYVEQGAGLVALQLTLLGLAVLFFVMTDLVEGRRREIALAKLRGQSRAALVLFALAEPVVVLMAAVPVGVALGWASGAVLSGLLLRAGTPVVLPVTAPAAAGLALLGAAAAAGLSARRVLVRPVLEQYDESPTLPAPRRAVLLSLGALVIAVGITALLLRTVTPGSPSAVLVPLLLLASAALIGVPLAVLLARALAPSSRASPRLVRFLTVRRLGRNPSTRRTAALLVVTLGLAVFAVGGQSVLTSNRTARAEAELGAPRVVPVDPESGTDPVAAVREVDPAGRWAMAAARWLPDGGDSVVGTVLAVDPTRLPAVGLPVRGGQTVPRLAAAIGARTLPPIALTGDRVDVRLAVRDAHGAAADVILVLRSPSAGETRVPLGRLRAGTHVYSAAVRCRSGCSVTGFVWTRPVLAEGELSALVTVQAVSAGRGSRTVRLDARLTRPRAWRAAAPVSESSDRVSTGPGGLTDAFRTASGEAGLEYASSPSPLPAVATPLALADQRPDPGWSVFDATNASISFEPVARVRLLPAVLDDGVLMDVRALDDALPSFASTAHWQVWLSASAPADAAARLDAAGLVPGRTTTVGSRTTELAREGPALAFSLLLALAVIAALLAVLSTAVTNGASARARTRDAAAMRLIGVPARVVLRAAVAEQVLVLLVAALLATPSGLLAILLVAPLLRQSAVLSPVPLTFVPDPAPLAVFLLAFLVVVGVLGAATAVGVVRGADPRRLREVDG